jgi:hypothetical protein
MCAVLSEHGVPISASTYYEWITKSPTRRQLRDAELVEIIAAQREDKRTGKFVQTLGSRKMWIRLRGQGHEVARCTVERIMGEQGWEGARYGSRHKTTIADDSHRRYPDRVDRNFCAPTPNRLWVADFTYVSTWCGFVYVLVTWNHAGGQLFVPRCHHELRGPVHCVGDLGREVAGLAASRAGVGVAADLGRSGEGTSHDRRIRTRPCGVSAGLRAGAHRPGRRDACPDRLVRKGIANSPELAWTESRCVGFGFGSGERDLATGLIENVPVGNPMTTGAGRRKY